MSNSNFITITISKYKKYFNLKSIIVFIIIILLLVSSLPIIVGKINRLRTLNSLKSLDGSSVYYMNYYLNYKLDDYLRDGSQNLSELYDFIDQNTSGVFKYSKSNYYRNTFNGSDECSAFSVFNLKNEPIVGRNLDLKGKHPILVLNTYPTKGFKSISVVEMPVLGYTDNYTELKTQLSIYKQRGSLLRAPYVPRDGMNEKGLVVATLNVPQVSIVKDGNKITIGRWQALRLMLDKASTVDEAISLLKTYDVFDSSVHYFIADASGTSAIVEYLDDKVAVIKKAGKHQVVTNFYLSGTEHRGTGKPRFKKAEDELENKNDKLSENDALKLLSKISENSTAYSVVYNQHSGTVYLCHDKDYRQLFSFTMKLTNK